MIGAGVHNGSIIVLPSVFQSCLRNSVMSVRLCLVLLSAVGLVSIVEAHPGRIDGFGGHEIRQTGAYHFHNKRKSWSSSSKPGAPSLPNSNSFGHSASSLGGTANSARSGSGQSSSRVTSYKDKFQSQKSDRDSNSSRADIADRRLKLLKTTLLKNLRKLEQFEKEHVNQPAGQEARELVQKLHQEIQTIKTELNSTGVRR